MKDQYSWISQLTLMETLKKNDLQVTKTLLYGDNIQTI